jgi:hypothetical protein
MTLDELLIDCCTRLNYPPDLTVVEPKVKTRLTAFLNQTQLEILGQPSYLNLLRVNHTLTTVAGVSEYGLPGDVDRIAAIVDRRNQRQLGMMSVDAYRRYLPDPSRQQGMPISYAFDGWASLQFQPTLAEATYVYSSAVDDGTVLFAQGVFATPGGTGEFLSRLQVVLNGAANGVQLAPAGVPFITEIQFSKPLVSSQTLIQANKPPTRLLSVVTGGTTRPRYAQVYLAPTPSGAQALDVFAERRVDALKNPADESVIPPRFHYILGAGARMKEYELRGDTTRYGVAKREFDIALNFLNSWMSTQPDANDQMVPDDGRRLGSSVLGPWFPSTPYR